MSSIEEELSTIANAIYGKDVRNSIVSAIRKVYSDAAKEGNANMEVEAARGKYETLKDRLDTYDSITFALKNETEIKANTNYELPISYKPGNIEIFFEGCKLIKDENYIEVLSDEENSNLIQFLDWDVPENSNLEFIIKGISEETEVMNIDTNETVTLGQILDAIKTSNGITSTKTDSEITLSGEELQTDELSEDEINEIINEEEENDG